MASRAKLRAVVGLVALLGCTPYVAPPPEPPAEAVVEPEVAWTVAQAEQDCRDGDMPACMEAIEYHRGGTRTYFDLRRALELGVHACAAGELDACYLAARSERELKRAEAAHARLVDACARGHVQSCVLLREAEVEQALRREVGLWRCAQFVKAARYGHGYEPHAWVSGQVWAWEPGQASKIELDPMPGMPMLQACVHRALATMSFPPAHGVRFSYKLPLESETVARALAELTPQQHEPLHEQDDRFALSSCNQHLDPGCESLPIEVLMNNAIYTPDADVDELRVAWSSTLWPSGAPISLNASLDFCIEPETGKTSRIRRSQPGLGQPLTELLILKISNWRFLPIVIDGKATLACGRIDFEIQWVTARSIAESRPSGPAPDPVSITPARAIYTPAPNLRALRHTQIGSRRNMTVINRIAYCIDTEGRVFDVETVSPWPRDPELEQILRDMVKTWRFNPLRIDGVPHESCDVQTFKLRFP